MPTFSPELTTELQRFAEIQNEYRPSERIAQQLAQKVLIMLVGPSAIGKSTIMKSATQSNEAFGRVSGFTSRSPRPDDDPTLYRYLEDDRMLEATLSDIADGAVVQYAVHPTKGTLYGSCVEDYPAPYNILDTLSSVANSLSQLPFKEAHAVSLTASPSDWRRWFLQRYPRHTTERLKRLKEARQSITWSLNQPEDSHAWLINQEGEPEHVVKELLNTITSNPAADSQTIGPAYAQRILQLIEQMERHIT